jgi:plasmid stability protein
MAQVLVRGVDDTVVERLKARAQRNSRSLEAELRVILQRAAEDEAREQRQDPAEIFRQLDALFEGQTFSDSAELIREDRDR